MQTTLTGTRKIPISDFKRMLSDMTTLSKKKPASVQEKFKQLCAELKKFKYETDQEEIINILKGIELLVVSRIYLRCAPTIIITLFESMLCGGLIPPTKLGISDGQPPVIKLKYTW